MSAEDDGGAEDVYAPSDHAAERALLAAMVESKNARLAARKVLTGADFYWPTHSLVYEAMGVLDRNGHPIDPVTLSNALLGYVQSHEKRTMGALLTDLTLTHVIPEHAPAHAAIVRRLALRRRYADEGRRLTQRALSETQDMDLLGAETVTRLTGLRDTGTEVSAVTLADLMADTDDTPEWVIPDLLERSDRLMLTGSEGAGKSALFRQIALMSAAGMHPFTCSLIPPIRTLIVDCENKARQWKRQARPLLHWLHDQGTPENPAHQVMVDIPGRINLLADRELSRIHQSIDAFRPDLVVLGPIYKMAPHALNSDDETAPFLAAIDTITERGCAVILEAHAGHGKDGVGKAQQRDLRPRGSASLMGWPEFGLGLRGLGKGLADLEPWRGGREQRLWPSRMRRTAGNRWEETMPDERPGDSPEYQPPPDPPDPQGSLNVG